MQPILNMGRDGQDRMTTILKQGNGMKLRLIHDVASPPVVVMRISVK